MASLFYQIQRANSALCGYCTYLMHEKCVRVDEHYISLFQELATLLGGHLAHGSYPQLRLSLIHISEPTRQAEISYAVFVATDSLALCSGQSDS